MPKKFNTLIVDDEPLARARINKLLSNFPDTIHIVGSSINGKEAKKDIEALKPDLVFLDIEMPGLTGFQLIQAIDYMPLIVFCTAHDNFALKAFETTSVDYLVKPVRLERLQLTINKLSRFNNTGVSQNILDAVNALTQKTEQVKKTSITIKTGDRLLFIKLEDIFYFEASSKYVTVFTKSDHYITDKSLMQLQTDLPHFFLRVHRGFIININTVLDVKKYFNSRYIITLTDAKKTTITSGRSYIDAIKKWIN